MAYWTTEAAREPAPRGDAADVGGAAATAAEAFVARARSYHPTLGTWVGRDPKTYADGANLHRYAQDNPVDRTDPSGLSPTTSPASPPPVTPNSRPTTEPDDLMRVAPAVAGPHSRPPTRPADLVRVVTAGTLVQFFYDGDGIPTFYQSVQVTGNCPSDEDMKRIQTTEKAEHGGADPTTRPIGDNATGDLTKPYGGEGRTAPNGGNRVRRNMMIDKPSFPSPPYPDDWRGEKSFETTIAGPDGHSIATYRWALIKDDHGVRLKQPVPTTQPTTRPATQPTHP